LQSGLATLDYVTDPQSDGIAEHQSDDGCEEARPERRLGVEMIPGARVFDLDRRARSGED
jgi:hypothetical protein